MAYMMRGEDEPDGIEQHGGNDHPSHEKEFDFKDDVCSPLEHEEDANEAERLASAEDVDDDAEGAEEYDKNGSEQDDEGDVLGFYFF